MFSLADDVHEIILWGLVAKALGFLASVGDSLLLTLKKQDPASSYGVGRGLV